MILRRIVQHVKKQEWTAITIDFAIVVLGVFVASQVTDWNNYRQDRIAEKAAVERLIAEYRQNLVILADQKARGEKAFNATRTLLSMTGPEQPDEISDESVSRPLADALSNPKFVPALGTTNSLIASGELDLIQDAEIQRLLSEWPVQVTELQDWQNIERANSEEIILGLTYQYLAWPTINCHVNEDCGQPSRFRSDYQGLFSDQRFEGLMFNHWYNVKQGNERMDRIADNTSFLIEKLEARLDEL